MPESLRVIPRESGLIAREYANILRSPALQSPLHRFLDTLASVDGLQGVGMAVWQERQIPPCLSVYPFLDLKDFGSVGSSSEISFRAVTEVYTPFYQAIYEVDDSLSSGISVVDTQGRIIEGVVGGFRTTLQSRGKPNHIIVAKRE